MAAKHPEDTKANNVYDVVVIGGGYSGIAATKYLLRHNVNVVCLEARDRIGGRVYTTNAGDPKNWNDLGGAYVGPTQDALLSWAEEEGVETYKVHTAGKNIFCVDGKRVVHEGTVPLNLGISALLDINHMLVLSDKMAETVPLHNPELTPNAAVLDTMTVHEWLRRNADTELGIKGIQAAVTSILTSEVSEVSLLSWLWYVRSAGSTMRLVEAENAAQERKFVGGTGGLLEKVAARFPAETIKLRSPVRCVRDWDSDVVTVETRDGRVYRAKHVIMAMAPSLYGRIEFSPALPALRQQLVQRMPMGCIIKTVTYYDRAWWREAGYSGSFFSENGPVWYSYDDCKPDGSKPAIMGFVLARHAREFAKATKEERMRAIAKQLHEIYEIDAALTPCDYAELDWSAEEFSAGCYVGVMPPQFVTNYFHEMRAPLGRIQFAGTEVAFEWSGYIDGAIRAGDAAALAVAKQLGKTKLSDKVPCKPSASASAASDVAAASDEAASDESIARPLLSEVSETVTTITYPPSKIMEAKPIGPTYVERVLLPRARTVKWGVIAVAVAITAAVLGWKFGINK